MSYSNPKQKNPAKKFVRWSSTDACFVYYDKENSEDVKIPAGKENGFYFVVLDELNTISGYNKEINSGIYANEVHSLSDEPLNVKSFKGNIKIVGKYAEIKNEINSVGGKFTKSLYAIWIKGKNDCELINIQLSGSGFQGWIDKGFRGERLACVVKQYKSDTVGQIQYNVPVFNKLNVPDWVHSIAIEEDKRLQAYLNNYKSEQQAKMTGNDDDLTHQGNHDIDAVYPDSAPPPTIDDMPPDNEDTSEINDLPF